MAERMVLSDGNGVALGTGSNPLKVSSLTSATGNTYYVVPVGEAWYADFLAQRQMTYPDGSVAVYGDTCSTGSTGTGDGIAAAIAACVSKRCDTVVVFGNYTLTNPIVLDKDGMTFKCMNSNNTMTTNQTQFRFYGGTGSGGTLTGNLACINVTNLRITIDGIRMIVTSIDYPWGIQSLSHVNSGLCIRNCHVTMAGTNTGVALKFTTQAHLTTVENCMFLGNNDSDRMNTGIYCAAGSLKSHFKDIYINHCDFGVYDTGSVDCLWERITIGSGNVTGGFYLPGVTSALIDSRNFATIEGTITAQNIKSADVTTGAYYV